MNAFMNWRLGADNLGTPLMPAGGKARKPRQPFEGAMGAHSQPFQGALGAHGPFQFGQSPGGFEWPSVNQSGNALLSQFGMQPRFWGQMRPY